MIDRKKVIKGLEQFRADLKPFCGNHADWERFDAALALLKEQEAVKIDVKKINNSGRCGRCPNCLMELNEVDYPNWCGNCGQAVKWE